MPILSWVQNKFDGGQEKRKPNPGLSSARYNSVPDARKEKINDWPQALLSIGTFGNREAQGEPDRQDTSENLCSSEDVPHFTIEEVNKLQKELTKFLSRKSKSSELRDEDRGNLPLDRFLNCPSSLEVDRSANKKPDDPENGNNGDLSPNTKIILSKARDALLGSRNSIKKKSFSFLLKKMFVCGNGFTPAPSLKEPIPETRMEKILRAILTKKIYPQSSSQISSKRYLDSKPADKRRDDKAEDKRKDQGKWVRTDSEYIVLEI